jgi:N-methylhydantoinase A
MAEITGLVGVDVGGTFTDFWYFTGKHIGQYKMLSTPENPEVAILEGLRRIGLAGGSKVIHGSTVATNAFLERKGARVAFVTTAGFEDLLEIGRQNRNEIYSLRPEKPDPIVAREGRFGIRERIDFQGREILPLAGEAIADLENALFEYGPESIAVVLINSFVNREHEERLGHELSKRFGCVFLSSQVNPEYREYERAITTTLTAYVAPIVTGYLDRLSEQLGKDLHVMASAGGNMAASRMIERPASMMLSGPAAGVVAANSLAELIGHERVVTFDMGGTSCDVAMLDGGISVTRQAYFDRLPIRIPMVDIHTVGAGGGSIAGFDLGGNLVVGPQSAGAVPGPACYGHGGLELTVTDANLLLGRIDPQLFLGGEMPLDLDAAKSALMRLKGRGAEQGIEIDPMQLAEGVVEVVNATMARAIRKVTAMAGKDPADFVLLSFGGAGGLHAVELAEALGIPEVLIPPDAGTFSAEGLARSRPFADRLESLLVPTDQLSSGELAIRLKRMAEACESQLLSEGVQSVAVCREFLDLRYVGESYELQVPWAGSLDQTVERFHQLHEDVFSYKDRASAVECVNLYVICFGAGYDPPFRGLEPHAGGNAYSRREVIFKGRSYHASCYFREDLSAGQELNGPALLVERSSTTFVPPGHLWYLDGFDVIHIKGVL